MPLRKLRNKLRVAGSNGRDSEEVGAASQIMSVIFIRAAVGLIFFTQGILKFIDPRMGVLRFAKIGFPYPYFTAHFVGTFEIVCGLLVLIGLLTRFASIPLLVVILTAIVHHQASRVGASGSGFLAYGERRENRFRHDDVPGVSEHRRSRAVVVRRASGPKASRRQLRLRIANTSRGYGRRYGSSRSTCRGPDALDRRRTRDARSWKASPPAPPVSTAS